jgi:hypothetical protein
MWIADSELLREAYDGFAEGFRSPDVVEAAALLGR